MNPIDYWRSNTELKHITANQNDPNPEGFAVADVLHSMIDDHERVIDFGCGTGRFAEAFRPNSYLGMDINPAAVAEARRLHPAWHFTEAEWPPQLAKEHGDVVLAYTVCLHMDDDAILDFAYEVATNELALVIAEIFGQEWRRAGDPPVFNRDLGDYYRIMRSNNGYSLTRSAARPYVRYASMPQFADRNTNIYFTRWEFR